MPKQKGPEEFEGVWSQTALSSRGKAGVETENQISDSNMNEEPCL